jgi:hypothetical protein
MNDGRPPADNVEKVDVLLNTVRDIVQEYCKEIV